MADLSYIRENIAIIRERIARAAERSGRNQSSVTLVAVTKTVDTERIREAVNTGIRDFGENYYQEFRDKVALFGPEIRWHFIGHLQSNKAKYLAGSVALIQSVDSIDLAREIGKRSLARVSVQDVLLEVMLDRSGAKFGVEPERTLEVSAEVASIPGVRLRGLMGMPPLGGQPEESRPYFVQLRELFERLPVENREIFSMGMTGDFEVAIEEGSTMVRIGTAIFGSRA